MTPPSTLQFQFRHALFPVNVEIKNDVLCVKYAIKYFEIPIRSLRYMYVDDDVNREMRELILCYRNSSGRTQRARIFSDHDQAAFDDLVQTLSLRVGEGHLTRISRRQAYEIMGSRSLEHIMIPALVFGAVFFVGLMLSPRLIHGWDGDPKIISMKRFDPNALTKAHVDLRDATVGIDTAIYEPTTPTETQPLEGQWHPVFAKGFGRTETRLIAYFHAKLEQPVQEPEQLVGLIRNVGIEQIPAQIRVGMKAQGIELHPNAVYLDVGATPQNDLYFFLMVMGPLLLIAATIVIAFRRSNRET